MNTYFCDFFNVREQALEEYGAFNISLVADLPLFIDPFLLFNSKKNEYKQLHKEIIRYLIFLKDKSSKGIVTEGLLRAWYTFKEVEQNWLGFSEVGNKGSGLGMKFAKSLDNNLVSLFGKFGEENITEESHLEKLCLIGSGVGRDNISDFTTNLIKAFLLRYTQEFALKHIDKNLLGQFNVSKSRFNYDFEVWEGEIYTLPKFKNSYVILTPKDLLTRDDTFINSNDMYSKIELLVESIDNIALRGQINNYLLQELKKGMKKKERQEVYQRLVQQLPEIIDYYIREKEREKEMASNISNEKVSFCNELLVNNYKIFVEMMATQTPFYDVRQDSFEEALERVMYLKRVIEDMDGYKIFYIDGQPIKREHDFQILYKLTWFSSDSDMNAEVNNGRGPVDFKASQGKKDQTLIEFKLASNSKLKQNLAKQLDVYNKANGGTAKTIKVILYFTDSELARVNKILHDLKIDENNAIVLIDGRKDNKESASNVK
ncbi:hypothetical protein [Zhenhengia yiwuensis]|uniref:PD-(D/E)XK nuclease superfamily protein n=1 Tax=Zhenhengia yiwuensis TaxID=2763666 RepID=A0A926EKJ8_9FIRM|nr:hypothetical protein [Zhenhengia yiwuensis]MBC8580185.1 hypothetical protein [Zhenhengia yiwuensis]